LFQVVHQPRPQMSALWTTMWTVCPNMERKEKLICHISMRYPYKCILLPHSQVPQYSSFVLPGCSSSTL
jgi:hypothetical protein